MERLGELQIGMISKYAQVLPQVLTGAANRPDTVDDPGTQIAAQLSSHSDKPAKSLVSGGAPESRTLNPRIKSLPRRSSYRFAEGRCAGQVGGADACAQA
jgi:hypothetical protein